MEEVGRYVIPVQAGRQVQSLCWEGDDLVDWVRGGTRYALDGTIEVAHRSMGYRFDRAVAFPDGRYAVIYEQLGTKGVILKEWNVVRQINRDFDNAEAFEYPIALLTLRDGREVIVHCPEEAYKLEIEDVQTGKRLTARQGEPLDIYHSRLQVSPSGRLLLSAGWVWHPWDVLQVYEIESVLHDPALLDTDTTGLVGIDGLEDNEAVLSAAFMDDERVVVGIGTLHNENPSIGIYSVHERRMVSKVRLEEHAGTLMPLGAYTVGFFEHPKLIEMETGCIVHRWPEIESGNQNSSIIWGIDTVPPLAPDSTNKRFAVAGEEAITVVQLG